MNITQLQKEEVFPLDPLGLDRGSILLRLLGLRPNKSRPPLPAAAATAA